MDSELVLNEGIPDPLNNVPTEVSEALDGVLDTVEVNLEQTTQNNPEQVISQTNNEIQNSSFETPEENTEEAVTRLIDRIDVNDDVDLNPQNPIEILKLSTTNEVQETLTKSPEQSTSTALPPFSSIPPGIVYRIVGPENNVGLVNWTSFQILKSLLTRINIQTETSETNTLNFTSETIDLIRNENISEDEAKVLASQIFIQNPITRNIALEDNNENNEPQDTNNVQTENTESENNVPPFIEFDETDIQNEMEIQNDEPITNNNQDEEIILHPVPGTFQQSENPKFQAFASRQEKPNEKKCPHCQDSYPDDPPEGHEYQHPAEIVRRFRGEDQYYYEVKWYRHGSNENEDLRRDELSDELFKYWSANKRFKRDKRVVWTAGAKRKTKSLYEDKYIYDQIGHIKGDCNNALKVQIKQFEKEKIIDGKDLIIFSSKGFPGPVNQIRFWIEFRLKIENQCQDSDIYLMKGLSGSFSTTTKAFKQYKKMLVRKLGSVYDYYFIDDRTTTTIANTFIKCNKTVMGLLITAFDLHYHTNVRHCYLYFFEKTDKKRLYIWDPAAKLSSYECDERPVYQFMMNTNSYKIISISNGSQTSELDCFIRCIQMAANILDSNKDWKEIKQELKFNEYSFTKYFQKK